MTTPDESFQFRVNQVKLKNDKNIEYRRNENLHVYPMISIRFLFFDIIKAMLIKN